MLQRKDSRIGQPIFLYRQLYGQIEKMLKNTHFRLLFCLKNHLKLLFFDKNTPSAFNTEGCLICEKNYTNA